MSVKYVHTNQQSTDILTSGSFTLDMWSTLMDSVWHSSCVFPPQPMFSRWRIGSACSEQGEKKPSKFKGASSKSIPEGQSAFAPHAVRHQKRSLLISAQDETQTEVQGQENPGQASGDRLHFSSSTGNPEVTEPRALDWKDYHWMSKKGRTARIVFRLMQRVS